MKWWWNQIVNWISRWFGGRERTRIIFLLAMALGLDGADLGAVGAMSTILQQHFHINKAQIGILITVSKGIGIFATLFFGRLVDRTRRTKLLAIAVATWAVAVIACGAAPSYPFLIGARMAMGAVAAATLPCVASLIGDYFPGREWGKIYGYILSGEISARASDLFFPAKRRTCGGGLDFGFWQFRPFRWHGGFINFGNPNAAGRTSSNPETTSV